MKRKAIYFKLKTLSLKPNWMEKFSLLVFRHPRSNRGEHKKGIKRSCRLACQSIGNFQFSWLDTRRKRKEKFHMLTANSRFVIDIQSELKLSFHHETYHTFCQQREWKCGELRILNHRVSHTHDSQHRIKQKLVGCKHWKDESTHWAHILHFTLPWFWLLINIICFDGFTQKIFSVASSNAKQQFSVRQDPKLEHFNVAKYLWFWGFLWCCRWCCVNMFLISVWWDMERTLNLISFDQRMST